MLKLEKIVGKEKVEEELEGEVIAGPSGEGKEHSSGNILLFFLNKLFLQSHSLIIEQNTIFFQHLITSLITVLYY